MENKIYWDNEKNIPLILNEERDNRKIKNLKEITSDLRPVFLEEKHLIKELFGLDEKIYLQSVWCNKNGRYLIDGVLKRYSYKTYIQKIKNIDKFRERIISYTPTEEHLNKEKEIFNNFIEENKEHLYYLLESRDIDEEGNTVGAYPFVEEVVKKYKKRLPMISFSGGKDSTVVSHIVRKALNEQKILHIFGDTTLELPLTYEYVRTFQEKYPEIPFLVEKNEDNDFFEMCKEIGPPSRVNTWCCSIFKTGPMGTTFSNFDEEFLTFYGVRRKESASRSKYPKILQSTKIFKQISVSPIIDWTDLEIWLYILSENLHFNSTYRLGYARVGCWVCPNRGSWSDFLANLYNNLEYKKWYNFLIEFSKNIGKEDYVAYVEEGIWKTRRGGQGIKKSQDIKINKKECVNEKNTYILNINRKIDKEFLTLLIPFGKQIINPKGKLQEVIVLDIKDNPLFKIIFKEGDTEIRLTIINLKDKYLYSKIMKQLNKFNMCIYCQACNSTCKYGALQVLNNNYFIDEKKCVHCLKCITKFDHGCLIASALAVKKE